jgi:hypothetical protein
MVFQHINCWYEKASHFRHVHSQALLISSLKAFEQNTGCLSTCCKPYPHKCKLCTLDSPAIRLDTCILS